MNGEDDDDKTVFRPADTAAPPPPEPVAPPSPPPPAAPPPAAPPPPMPRTVAGVQVGDVLNHMFEVKRFIARGGMGEVFEGINVASDEPVAIKIILPALAADPNVTAMFRKEAQTLTRLSHPALVQYRVLAQEPQLGVFYIVTDFIDGTELKDVLGKIAPSPQELIGFTRRLAEGLRAAHDLGAIHRDIAPDNVLLPGGRLDRARIIDFGIAKDVDPGSKTIIGDGFAGKLGYVAPEQLGIYGRDVGPWTDVYSLGLVILALAQGKGADLGGSFLNAIDKRRAGVETTGAPAELRPLLDRMLAADPAERLRDMGEVLAALNHMEGGHGIAPPAPPAPPPPPSAGTAAPAAPVSPPTPAKPAKVKVEKAPKPPKPPKTSDGKSDGKISKPVLIGGSVGVVALVGIVSLIAFGGGSSDAPPVTSGPAQPAAASGVDATAIRAAVEKELPSLGCTWLTLTTATQTPQGASLAFTGVAGRPADAEASVFKAVQGIGAAISASDFSGVAPIDASFCPALDRLRLIRATGAPRLSVSQPKYEISAFAEGDFVGQQGARVIIDLALADLSQDFALYSIEETGEVSEIVGSRSDFIAASETNKAIEKLPGRDHYRLQLDGVRKPGWSGILLLTGRGGFDESLLKSSQSAGFAAHFDQVAKSNDWKAEVVWFKFVDEVPN